MNRRLLAHLLTGALCAAGIAMIIGALSPHEHTVYRLALGVATLAGTGLMVLRTQLTEAALERARMRGYDDGYADRCTVERRSELRLVGSAGARGLIDGAAQDLGREGNVGSGA